MARLGRRSSEFADSDEENGYGGGDLMNFEEESLWSYGVSQMSERSGSLRVESASACQYPVDLVEPAIVHPKLKTFSNNMLIPIIDHKIDEHVGKMLHVVGSLSIRLSKMDMKTSQLETSVGQLNSSLEWQHERTHEKLRQLEEIMKEVQGTVKDLKDKYEIAETQIELTKNKTSKKHLPQQKSGTILAEVMRPTSTVFSPDVTFPTIPGINLKNPSDLPCQNLQPPASIQTHIQLPPVSTHNLLPTTPYHQSLPHIEQRYGDYGISSYPDFQPTYAVPSIPYESASNSNHAQSTQINLHSCRVNSQQQTSFVNYGEGLQAQRQNYYCGPFSQFSGISQRAYDFESGSPHFDLCDEPFSEKGLSTAYSPHPYGVPTKDDASLSHFSLVDTRRNNMQFPVYEATELSLPHALPMASFIDEEPNTSSSENCVSTDEADVIDKVTAMGFRRDTVKVTAKKLKENGQLININAVLDKLMTGG